MVSKRLKQIMSEDERLFKAMSPEQFGKGPPALKSIPKAKVNPQIKKDQRKANRGISQFNVLPFGVLDALSNTLFKTSQGKQESIESLGESQGAEQSTSAAPTESPVSQDGPRAEEEKASASVGSELQVDQSGVQPPIDVDFDIESPFKDADSDNLGSLFAQDDVLSPSFQMDSMDVGSPDLTMISKGTSFKTPEAQEVEDLAEDGGQDELRPLVRKRRERAERERQAAARNFAKSRGQFQQQESPEEDPEQEQSTAQSSESPSTPVMGIPAPVPISKLEGEQTQVDAASSDEEMLGRMDAAVSQSTELAGAIADVMDKMITELTSLSVRVRNMELLLDRL